MTARTHKILYIIAGAIMAVFAVLWFCGHDWAETGFCSVMALCCVDSLIANHRRNE